MNLRRVNMGIGECLEGGKGRKKQCNCNVISKKEEKYF